MIMPKNQMKKMIKNWKEKTKKKIDMKKKKSIKK